VKQSSGLANWTAALKKRASDCVISNDPKQNQQALKLMEWCLKPTFAPRQK
jgi:hypothetical protein